MMNQKNKNNSGKLLLILLLLITLAGAGTAGFSIYQIYYTDPGPDDQMANIHLKNTKEKDFIEKIKEKFPK